MAKSTTTKPKTTKTTTTRKRTTTKRTTSTKAAKAPEPVVVAEVVPEVSAPELKKAELVDAVVERTGVKKRDAKPAVEAALALMGEALAEGRDLNLRTLGKIKVKRKKELSNGAVLVARIRQPKIEEKAADTESDGVADAAE